MAKKQCNFCGRTEKEVKLLITGVDGCICEDCAVQAYQVAMANGFGPDAKKQKTDFLNALYDLLNADRFHP